MTDVIENLLHEAATTPSHELDVHALIARTRLRRRRFVGAVAAAVVVVLATVGIVAIATGGSGRDDAQIAIGPRDDGTPDGWTRVQLAQGTSIAVPAGWEIVPRTGASTSLLGVVGTDDPGMGDYITPCGVPVASGPPNASRAPAAGAWVFVHEIQDTALVNGRLMGTLPTGGGGGRVWDRPSSFGPENIAIGGACNLAPVPDGDTLNDSAWVWYMFADHGRTFAVQVVVNDPGNPATTTEIGDRVLDTFLVDSDDPTIATTTTVPTATTVPATTTPPPADASADELAIRDLYAKLLRAQPRYAIGDYVEDYASITDSWLAGIAQVDDARAAQYTIRVNSVTMRDDSHADVNFSLVFAGQAQGGLPGGAVKIDGRWYITRETICTLVAGGAITCPARTTPVP